MLKGSVIIKFEDIITVSISLVMEYLIFHKVIIFIIMYRLHTMLTHPLNK